MHGNRRRSNYSGMEVIEPSRKGRLIAATLLESVLAMGLMATALSFAVGLHFRILASDKASDLMQAWSMTERVIAQYETGAAPFGSSASEANDPRYELTVSEKAYAPGSIELTITCTRHQRRVLQRQCIIPALQ